jgi:gamma-polyglutamate biosynthesis protein CapA
MIRKTKYVFVLMMLLLAAVLLGAVYEIYSARVEQEPLEMFSPVGNEPDNAGFFPSMTEIGEKRVSFIFAGDLMFDRYIRQIANEKDYDYILEGVGDILKSVDFTVVNLEGPITNNKSVSVGSKFGSYNNYIFTFGPKVIDILKQFNMVASLGNNHITNFGQDGIKQTVENLKGGGVMYFGQVGQETVNEYVVLEEKGFRIDLVNYNQFIGSDKEEVFKTITALVESSDFLVVYAHWGNEYVPVAGKVITDLAHEFVDLGADLVIGSHPHVVQQVEVYKGKKIYYSLGNFVFDQYFSEETMKGLLVKVDLVEKEDQNTEVAYEDIPIKLSPSGQTLLF